MHRFPQTCRQTRCTIARKNAWIPTDMLTDPRIPTDMLTDSMFTCTWKCMDSLRHAYESCVHLHVKMDGFPQTCLQTLCSTAFFPKQCSHIVGVLAVTLGLSDFFWRPFGRLRRPTFMRRRGTSCMSPRSRADETLGRVTFCRKT